MQTTGVEEIARNPNVGFLEGKRCPKCGSYGPFEVVVSMRVLLYDDGTEKDGDAEFDGDSPAECQACGHEAKLDDFGA